MASVATSARCRRNNVGLVGRTCCGPSAMLSRTGQRAGARVNRRGEHARSGVPGSPTGPRIRRVRRTLCGYTLGTPARRRATAMYLVAAGDQREALTLPRPGPRRPTAPPWAPSPDSAADSACRCPSRRRRRVRWQPPADRVVWCGHPRLVRVFGGHVRHQSRRGLSALRATGRRHKRHQAHTTRCSSLDRMAGLNRSPHRTPRRWRSRKWSRQLAVRVCIRV